MATITKADGAPSGDLTLLLANEELTLSDGGSVETDNEAVIANARSVPFLIVEVPAVPLDTKPANYDPNDPHQNPTADHLSTLASPEAVAAADANEAAIRKVNVAADNVASDETPSVGEVLTQELRASGVRTDPALPVQANESAPAAPASPPERPAPERPAPAEQPAPSNLGASA